MLNLGIRKALLKKENKIGYRKQLSSILTNIYTLLPWLLKSNNIFLIYMRGKESTCNAGDPGLIPGSGRSTGEGIGYHIQYSWASLVVQRVRNLPAMREIWVQSLGCKDPWKRERLSSPVFWPGELHGLYSSWGCKKSDMTEWLSLSCVSILLNIIL